MDLVDEIIADENKTFIDMNDELYEADPSTLDLQVNQLAFLQYFNYLHHAYRFVSPLDWIYIRATDETIVQCKPTYNPERELYEMLCVPAS